MSGVIQLQYNILANYFSQNIFSDVIKVELESLSVKDHTPESVTSFADCQVQSIICLNSVSKTVPV